MFPQREVVMRARAEEEYKKITWTGKMMWSFSAGDSACPEYEKAHVREQRVLEALGRKREAEQVGLCIDDWRQQVGVNEAGNFTAQLMTVGWIGWEQAMLVYLPHYQRAALGFVRDECARIAASRSAAVPKFKGRASDTRAAATTEEWPGQARGAPPPRFFAAATPAPPELSTEGGVGTSSPPEHKVWVRCSLVPFQGGKLLTYGVEYEQLRKANADIVAFTKTGHSVNVKKSEGAVFNDQFCPVGAAGGRGLPGVINNVYFEFADAENDEALELPPHGKASKTARRRVMTLVSLFIKSALLDDFGLRCCGLMLGQAALVKEGLEGIPVNPSTRTAASNDHEQAQMTAKMHELLAQFQAAHG
ncbi:hypothetical protein FOA52_010131 [Chlamydomonas sp. UWO 241]|nr:hypothetical protein FOA52_010131 [Chlamydomonas sp. UWO 241]